MDTSRWPKDTYKETIIGPTFASNLLDNVHPTSSAGVVPWVVELYKMKMLNGDWEPQFLSSPGHPILTKGGELIYGVQRCMACVQSDTPFETVLVELPANHQGYY